MPAPAQKKNTPWYLLGPEGQQVEIPADEVHVLNGDEETQRMFQYKKLEVSRRAEIKKQTPELDTMLNEVEIHRDNTPYDLRTKGESTLGRYLDEAVNGSLAAVTFGYADAVPHRRTIGEGLMYYAAYTAGLVGTWEVGMGAARALGAAGGIATQAGVAAVQTFAERDDEATWGDRASRAAFAALGLGVSMKGANVVGKAFRGLRKVVEEAPAVVEETSAATSGGGFYKMLTEGDEAIIRGAEEMHKDGVGVAVEDLKALKPGTQPPPAKVAARMDPYTPRNPVEYLRKMQAEAPASASWGVDDTLRESYKAQETAPIPQNIMQYTQRLQREKELAQQGLVNSVLEQPRSVGAAAARPRTYREVEPEFIATTPGRATVVYKEPSGRRVGYSELFYADYSGKKVKVPSRKGLRPMTKADLARETPLYEIEHLEVAPGFSASVLHDLRGQGAEYFKPGTPSQRALAKHLGGEAVQPGRYNIPSPNEGRLIETVTDPGPDRWKQALNDVKAPRPKVLREDVYNIDDALTSLKNTRRK